MWFVDVEIHFVQAVMTYLLEQESEVCVLYCTSYPERGAKGLVTHLGVIGRKLTGIHTQFIWWHVSSCS